MFRKMQIKMTAYYSVILIFIIFCINLTTYFTLNSYNERQISKDTKAIINNIASNEWMEDSREENKAVSDDDKYEEFHESENATERAANGIKTPGVLKTFYFYYIFSNTGELLRYYIPDRQYHELLMAEAKKSGADGNTRLLEISRKPEIYLDTYMTPIYHDGKKLGEAYVGRDVTIAFETMNRLWRIIIVSSIIGVMLSILIGYFIAGKAVKPIKEAYEVKQRFIADASHELRTPLSIISLSSEILLKELPPSEEFLQSIASDISEESIRMTNLVENLLLLARSDSKGMRIHQEDFHLDTLIERACSSLGHLARDKNITLENLSAATVSGAAPIELIGDSKLISNVIFILVENGIKYSPENGKVTIESGVELHNNKPMAFIRVKDTGIGIPQDEIPNIFNRFYRVDASRAKTTNGHGLGLSIAKEIIEVHHGSIHVESALGKGSCFTVLLPLS